MRRASRVGVRSVWAVNRRGRRNAGSKAIRRLCSGEAETLGSWMYWSKTGNEVSDNGTPYVAVCLATHGSRTLCRYAFHANRMGMAISDVISIACRVCDSRKMHPATPHHVFASWRGCEVSRIDVRKFAFPMHTKRSRIVGY
jgi:hypothetical protein